MSAKSQLTIPIPLALREFLERRAEEEDRPLASVVRRLIAEAQRQSQLQTQERAA